MNLLAVSINHHTAPVEIRENFHLSVDEIRNFINTLKGNLFSEGFILSTCNRTELYGFPVDNKIDYRDLQHFLIEKKPIDSLSPQNFQNFFAQTAVNHLFKISGGIDSQLIGDNQILGQVKEAFQISDEMNFAGFLSKRIFDSAIKVGKRAKTETEINEGAITISYAAVQLIEKIFSNLNRKSALVIGAGETGEIAAKHLRDKNIGALAVTNRTLEKAEAFAETVKASILPFEYFKEQLHEFDIIVSATSAPDFILSVEDVKSSMKKRNGGSTCLMDIAVPRDIDPAVKNIDNVFYHDIDSLKIIVDQNIKRRQSEIPKVQQIITEEMAILFNWYNSLEITPVVKSLRSYFEQIRSEEIERVKHKLSPEDFNHLDMVTKRIINKLLHTPTVELKKITESNSSINSANSGILIDGIKTMFGLNPQPGKNGKAEDDNE